MSKRVSLFALALGATLCTAAFAASAQSAPADPTAAGILQTLWTWGGPALSVVGAFGILMTVLGHFVLLLAVRWPKLGTFAQMLVALGGDVGKFAKNASALFRQGGSTPPAPPSSPAPPAARTGSGPAMPLGAAASLAALALVASLSLTGCSGFLSGLATSNPVVDATAFENAANVADGIAVNAFQIIEPLLPAADQAVAQADFAKAQATYQGVIAALNDAIQAYQDGTSQNWTSLYTDIQNAIDAIVAIVDSYGGSPAAALSVARGSSAFVTERALLTTAVATVHKYR